MKLSLHATKKFQRFSCQIFVLSKKFTFSSRNQVFSILMNFKELKDAYEEINQFLNTEPVLSSNWFLDHFFTRNLKKDCEEKNELIFDCHCLVLVFLFTNETKLNFDISKSMRIWIIVKSSIDHILRQYQRSPFYKFKTFIWQIICNSSYSNQRPL